VQQHQTAGGPLRAEVDGLAVIDGGTEGEQGRRAAAA
jgi:hypothetical protein